MEHPPRPGITEAIVAGLYGAVRMWMDTGLLKIVIGAAISAAVGYFVRLLLDWAMARPYTKAIKSKIKSLFTKKTQQ